MLEVKHLKKEYRTKKGAVTRALDDVSLNFPETGMVFILGKSGSGKSTLLNVCGGLDRMDSGEIIIKGKSSNEFSGQDFDSYRNTYVGFVFQEYNILDEFTVEQNIALALELQNKKPDKAAIDKILADVDMTDFASRKPNTLSGGQKQRVAIARALVKEPEIIMADEPTGALDSKTGQQVFDTLKKLSKEKLVLVISHDRDFAEQYGDRIIELKDGKILSDQTRAETDGQQNVKFFGTDTVCVASGSELTDDDLKQIKNFLAKAGGTAVISTSREKIAQFKEDRPEIDVGTFENIKEQPTPKQYEPQKLIRSHLPIKHAIKMGAGSLKTKPVRLVFTIFLSVIAFILFGLASTLMLFDGHSVTVQSFQDSGIDYISMGKVYYVTETSDNYSGENVNNTLFTDEEYDALVKKYSGAIAVISDRESIDNVKLNTMASRFYSSYTNGVVNGDDKLTYVAGRKPQALDEVAISEFMFDGFKSSGTRFLNGVDNTEVELRTAADILSTDSKPITLKSDDIQLKIVGVFKSMQVPADFKTLKEAADNNDTSANIGFSEYTWSVEMENGFYNVIAVSPEMYALVKDEVLNGEKNIDYSYYFKYSESSITMGYSLKQYEAEDNWNTYSCSSFNTYGEKALKLYGLDGKEKNTVGNGEIAISYKALASVLYNKWWEFRDALNNDEESHTMLSKKWDVVRSA
ncbi:MAG: ABC transporter ATP-binding protein [Clostridiales bacterium]|nr:ABC transporter ATP-binding protein [Clostridiales bacterium]